MILHYKNGIAICVYATLFTVRLKIKVKIGIRAMLGLGVYYG